MALVKRWRRSGQTARRFAKGAGVNAATLTHWAWRLKREGKSRAKRTVRRGRRGASGAAPARFVELRVDGPHDGRFVLELGDGWRLQIPPGFDGAALERLLAVVVEGRP
jgi:hypothetical protein